MVKVYDSQRKEIIIEDQFKSDFLRFLYNTVLGRLLLRIVFMQSWFWKYAASFQKLRSTSSRVNRYVKKYDIAPTDYTQSDWRSFYDFFGRQLKPGAIKLPTSRHALIAIAEAKLLAVSITSGLTLTVKHRKYDLTSIVGSRELAEQYKGGTALVYRLSMHNYHRYLFPDDGRLLSTNHFTGVLHTVSSISRDYPVYSINQRVVSVLSTEYFSEVVMIEVGAMMVGKIVNTVTTRFSRGQEKGSFKIGGSTIILLYKKATIELKDEIKKYNERGIEVMVNIGEGIGHHV